MCLQRAQRAAHEVGVYIYRITNGAGLVSAIE